MADTNSFDWEKYYAHLSLGFLKEGTGWLGRHYRKDKLARLLKKDFEHLTLPEEIELGLLEKNRTYPLLVNSRSEIPSDLKTFVPVLNFVSSITTLDVQRALYHISVLNDNFLKEARALLTLEASYGLLLAHTKIRAFRNYDDRLVKLFNKMIEKPTRLVKEFIDKEIADFDGITGWTENFYSLFEAGLFFSIILPKMKEVYEKQKGRITRVDIEEFEKFIKNLIKIEETVRNEKKVDTDLLIFEGKLLGRIGIILVSPPPEVPSLIEEKINKKCSEVIILSRWIYNNLFAVDGTLEAISNINIRDKVALLGIKNMKIEESYNPNRASWSTAIRITIAKKYLDSYEKKVTEIIKQSTKPKTFEAQKGDIYSGLSAKELRQIKKRLQKKSMLFITNGNELHPTYILEVVRVLRMAIHFTENLILFTNDSDPKNPYPKIVVLLERL